MFRVREQHHDGVKQTRYDSATNLKEKTQQAPKKQARRSGERVCSATAPSWGETLCASENKCDGGPQQLWNSAFECVFLQPHKSKKATKITPPFAPNQISQNHETSISQNHENSLIPGIERVNLYSRTVLLLHYTNYFQRS